MDYITVPAGKSSPDLTSLFPIHVHLEWPAELPAVVVIDSPAEWAFLLLAMAVLIRWSRRE